MKLDNFSKFLIDKFNFFLIDRRISGTHDHEKIANELTKVFKEFNITVNVKSAISTRESPTDDFSNTKPLLVPDRKHQYSISDGATNFGLAFQVYGEAVQEEELDEELQNMVPPPPPTPPPPQLRLDKDIPADRGKVANHVNVLLEEDEIGSDVDPKELDEFIDDRELLLSDARDIAKNPGGRGYEEYIAASAAGAKPVPKSKKHAGSGNEKRKGVFQALSFEMVRFDHLTNVLLILH